MPVLIGAAVIDKPPSTTAITFVLDLTDRKRSEEALHRSNRTLTLLLSVNEALVRATDESMLLREVCRIAVEVGGYRMAWVGFRGYDEDKPIIPVAHAGYEAGYFSATRMSWADNVRGQGPAGVAIRTGRPSFLADSATDQRYAEWREEALARGYRSIISLPLLFNGETMGAVNLYRGEPQDFDREEQELLMQLASDLAYGISSLRLRFELKRAEEQKREFYRRTILAATQGKLVMADREDIEQAAGPPVVAWSVRHGEELGAIRHAIKRGAGRGRNGRIRYC